MNKGSKIKFVFFGTPAVAANMLQILKDTGFIPTLIVTAPDKPAGRKQIITSPPVKIWAKQNGVPVLQPDKLDSKFIYKLKAISYKLFIVVAYGKILPEELINFPQYGTLNLHYSLLPKYRGAAPVQVAILAGDIETGVSIQRMEFKLDSGPVLAEEKTFIGPDETAPELEARLTELGGNLLIKTLPDFIAGKITLRPQDESAATYCKKIKKENGEVRLDEPAETLWRKYRAYFDWPGLYFFKPARPDDSGRSGGNGKKTRVLIKEAEYKNNVFIIKKVLPEGRKMINYETFLNQLR